MNAEDDEKCTPLHYAGKNCNIPGSNFGIENAISLNYEPWMKYVAIFSARCGRADACRLLLEAGSSHAAADIASWTPLLWTCYKGTSIETADVLIRHGADVNAVGIHHISGR